MEIPLSIAIIKWRLLVLVEFRNHKPLYDLSGFRLAWIVKAAIVVCNP